MSLIQPTRPGAGERSVDSLSLFTFLWAVAILTHQAMHGGFSEWRNVPLIAIAFATVLRPSSLVRLTALCIAQIVMVGLEMPDALNHWLLLALANITILTVIATRPGRQPDGSWDRTAVYQAVAPPLRLVIVGTYSFAFLAKLNPDFFNPDLSCAGVLYPRFATRLVSFPTDAWTRMPVIWLTFAFEAAMPLLLAIRSTRVLGVFVAFLFHVILGLAGFYDFSAVAAAFLVLFLPDDMPELLAGRAARHSWIAWCADRCRRFAQMRVALPLVLVVAYGVMTQIHRFESPFSFTMQVWFVFAVAGLIALMLTVLDRAGVTRAHSHLRVARPVYLFGPLLIVLNGLSPYVGLKTENSFIMFSNLRTEGEYANHFLVPRSVQVFGMQDDIVRIIDSSSQSLRRYAQSRDRLVWHEFQSLARTDPSMSVTFELRGQRYEVPRVGDDPLLSRPPNPLVAKLFGFRTVQRRCGH